MIRLLSCLIGALLIALAAPALAANHAPTTHKSPTIARVAKPKPPTVRSMQVKLRKAQARAKVAETQAMAARTALDTERSRYARSRGLNIVMAMVATAAIALVVVTSTVCWRMKKKTDQRIAAVERDLALAHTALEHQKAAQATDRSTHLQSAFAEIQAAAVQRDNLGTRLKAREASLLAAQADIKALKDDIALLEAAAVKRQAASAKAQIRTLKQVSSTGGGMLAPGPVLNDDEQRLFPLLQGWANENRVRLLAQVSMGEFLAAAKGAFYSDLFATYNSKRVDFLICNDDWSPRFIIEHFGGGHFGKGYALQDEIKSRLLALSGLGLVITLEDDLKEDILERVNRAHLAPASAVPACEPFERVMPPWSQGKTKAPSFFRPARAGRIAEASCRESRDAVSTARIVA